MSATKDKRVRVINHGKENWRTEVLDNGQWVITGPPYATKTEALLYVDYVVKYCFE